MKPLIEKLPLETDNSFVARTYRTPHFEVPWHQHPELEIIFFREGEGNAFVGNHVGEFTTGDVYMLGANLPHTFQKADPDLPTAALVIQFLPDCWGDTLLDMPEARDLRQLFSSALMGLKIAPAEATQLAPLLLNLEQAQGFKRLLLLWEVLHQIAQSKNNSLLSTHEMGALQTRQQARIDMIFRYTIEHYAQPITLEDVAAEAGMTVPAFCHYFRKSTKKTYIEFLNEVRIGKASQQLIDTQKTVAGIAYECGYNTLANFNKQFLRIRGMRPSDYRKVFSETTSHLSFPECADSGKQYR